MTMKKMIVLCLAMLMLTACSQSQTMVSDPDEKIISGDGVNYTKQDLFNDLKKNDFTNIVLADLTEKIADFEEVDTTKVDEEVTEYVNNMKETYGDSYEAIIEYYGGEESFSDNLRSNYLLEAIEEKYCETNYDSLVTEYTPVLAKVVSFEDQATAEKMIADINGGASFEDAAKTAGIQTTVSDTVYTKVSDVNNEVWTYLSEAETIGLCESPIVSLKDSTNSDGSVSTTQTYYVIEITGLDANEFREDFYDAVISDIGSATVYNYYFNKYNVEVYDQQVYEKLSTYEGIK